MLVSQPAAIRNRNPHVNQDAHEGLRITYSRSVDPERVGVPLAVMVSVLAPAPGSR